MSIEHYPCNEIPFDDLFDGRLKRFGITTAAKTGALIAPDGTPMFVLRTDKGYAQFPENMPVLIRNAMAAEFGTDLSECGELTHVVIEGPSCGDAQFISRWLNVATECDRLLQQHFTGSPEFRKSIFRLEIEYLIEFAPAAAAFIRKWLKDRQSFHLNLRNSPWAEIFTVMVGIGFFTRTGRHYHMTVPHPIELDRVTDSLLQFAETEDAEYYLHPERHLVAMTGYQAKGLRQSLRGRGEKMRLEDREKLLANREVDNADEELAALG
jgi:hypothetical protein